MKKFLFILAVILPVILNAQLLHSIHPSETGSNITVPDAVHLVYINTGVSAKNKLFLFLPGTGGYPVYYTYILKEAANLGYHSIGLTYPNSVAINSNEVCGNISDTTCHSRARYEVFDGRDRIQSIDVDTNNCIHNRVLKLLQYLVLHFPGEGWAQYVTGDSIRWEKIIISGHSQGGGHAGFISKIRPVDRVIMFCSLDWVTGLNRSADWVTWKGPTSVNKYFGMGHQRDELVPFAGLIYSWQDFGMYNYGPLVLADTASDPYSNSHILYSNILPRNDTTNFHGSPVVDYYTPLDESNVPVLKPVWDYLIDHPFNSAVGEISKSPDLFLICRNPSEGILVLKRQSDLISDDHYQIFNSKGILIKEVLCSPEIKIPVSDYPDGLYLICLKKHFSGTKKFLK